MVKKIIKIGTLFIFITFIVSGCSFSFPWEKDRRGEFIEIEEGGNDLEIEEENKKEESQEINVERELRQFTSLKAAQDYIKTHPALASNLEQLSFTANYAATSQLAVKDLLNSSVFTSRPDWVQVVNEYIYILKEEKIQVVSITSLTSPTIVNERDLPFQAQEMKIFEDNLIVTGIKNNRTFLYVFDISNPLNMELRREIELSGNYAGMYISAKQLYFLTTNKLDYRQVDNLLPDVYVKGKRIDSHCVLNDDCLRSQVYYFNHPYNSYGFLSVMTFDLEQTSGLIKRQLYLLDDSYRLYLSKNNDIYLTKEHYLTKEYLEAMVQKELFTDSLEPGDKIKVTQADADVEKLTPIFKNYLDTLGIAEKEEAQIKIEAALKTKIKDLDYELEGVSLYKFVAVEGKLRYEAKGEVAGRFLDGNFIDEEAGYLRLITKRGELWPLLFSGDPKEYSNAYVLDKDLKIVGSLENIVTGNSLAQAHFLNNRSYLFTTEETDPIYVIDWQNKEKPAILGALQINGYTNFYPADLEGERLLAFGKTKKEATVTASTLTQEVLKLSLFDFSDLKKPSELSSYIIGDELSDSFALQDYKSLANIFVNKIIIVPASFQDQGVLSFSGVLVFSADANGILNLLYRIDHSANGQIANDSVVNNFTYLNNTVRRSFIKQNYLFTISNKYLKINNLNDGSEIASVILLPSPEDDLINSNFPTEEYDQITPPATEEFFEEEIITNPEEYEINPEPPLPSQSADFEIEPIVGANEELELNDEMLETAPESETIIDEQQALIYDEVKCKAMCTGLLELEFDAYCVSGEDTLNIYDFCNLES